MVINAGLEKLRSEPKPSQEMVNSIVGKPLEEKLQEANVRLSPDLENYHLRVKEDFSHHYAALSSKAKEEAVTKAIQLLKSIANEIVPVMHRGIEADQARDHGYQQVFNRTQRLSVQNDTNNQSDPKSGQIDPLKVQIRDLQSKLKSAEDSAEISRSAAKEHLEKVRVYERNKTLSRERDEAKDKAEKLAAELNEAKDKAEKLTAEQNERDQIFSRAGANERLKQLCKGESVLRDLGNLGRFAWDLGELCDFLFSCQADDKLLPGKLDALVYGAPPPAVRHFMTWGGNGCLLGEERGDKAFRQAAEATARIVAAQVWAHWQLKNRGIVPIVAARGDRFDELLHERDGRDVAAERDDLRGKIETTLRHGYRDETSGRTLRKAVVRCFG